jgi:hypothetical protein
MSAFYAAAYWVGFRPWETVAAGDADKMAAMCEREEVGRQPPSGMALDLRR